MIDVNRLMNVNEECEFDVIGNIIAKISEKDEDLANLIKGDYRLKDVVGKSCSLQIYAITKVLKDLTYALMGLRGVTTMPIIFMLKENREYSDLVYDIECNVIPYLSRFINAKVKD